MNRLNLPTRVIALVLLIVGSPSATEAQRIQTPFRPSVPTISPQAQPQAGNQIQNQNATVMEAERQINKVSMGTVITQDMRQFGNWSGNNQILWIDNRPNQRLELQFTSPQTGRFPVTVFMSRANDFANLAIGYNGRQLAAFSGFSTNVTRTPVALGQLDLRAGANTLIFNVTGKDRRSTGYRVGIDSIQVAFGNTMVRPDIPMRQPPGSLPRGGTQIPNPGIPGYSGQGPGPFRPDAKNPGDNPVIHPRLSGGADLYVRNGDFTIRAPQQLGTGNYMLGLTYDVSKVPGAGAVIMQVVQSPFRTEFEGDGYPQMEPYSLAQTGKVLGPFGHFRFDTRKAGNGWSQPANRPDYHVRVIPVVSGNNLQVVGKASNIIEIYYNKPVPGTNIELAKFLQVHQFADMVEARLASKCSGYAFAIIPKGQSPVYRSGGVARTSTDGSPRKMTVHDRVNQASVTKFLVAIASVKAIDQHADMTIDTKIEPYLPAGWIRGPNVDTVTFRELLRHLSGFRPGNANSNDDEGLRKMIETGIPDITTKNSEKYVNQNFALMRKILPRIKFTQGTGGDGAQLLREVYLSVLSPAGIDWASAEPDANTALSHPFPTANFKGTDWGATIESFGSSGLHMSAAEIARLMDRFMHTEDIIRADLRDELIGFEIGCNTSSDIAGRCFGKGGYLRSEPPDAPGSSPARRTEISTLVYSFSDGTSIGLVVNSSHADFPTSVPRFGPMLRECFNACYKPF